MELNQKLLNFKNEIDYGIKDIQQNYSHITQNIEKPEYAFLYWILTKLYNIDESLVEDQITEYHDKSIDCFVHFEDNKELYIIQCKYHNDISAPVDRKDVSDFLQIPLTALLSGTYKKSQTLQNIFNKAIADPEYKINFHFYSNSDYFSDDIKLNFQRFNSANYDCDALLLAEYFDLKGIYEKFYGESFKEKKNLTFSLGTVNKGTFASLREEYKIEGLRCEAYYIITPISEIYRLRRESKKDGYSLFEENIRDFLGDSAVNKGIIDTLRGTEKNNFLFYNNGITMICSKVGKEDVKKNMRYIPLTNPQIVNGCQTVNSIYIVLDSYSDKDISSLYQNVFVMVKVLVIAENSTEDKEFYRNVVKYTNRQNSVPDKAFLSNDQSAFTRLQKEFLTRGFFLKVKQSDKTRFDLDFTEKQKADILVQAKNHIKKIGYELKSYKDICIDLEKLLQVLITYIKDGYYGYTKKSYVLKQNSDVFNNISANIQDYMSIDNMINLYYLYKRAEQEQKQSNDKRSPIPYYVIGFISFFINKDDIANMNTQLDKIFALNEIELNELYKYLCGLSDDYKSKCQGEDIEYNVMIKQKINYQFLNESIHNNTVFCERHHLKDYLTVLQID